MKNTNSKTTRCIAAVTGNGYWVCDVLGGCRGCRDLALGAEDKEQLKAWLIERSAR